jgi:hypothetical protein
VKIRVFKRSTWNIYQVEFRGAVTSKSCGNCQPQKQGFCALIHTLSPEMPMSSGNNSAFGEKTRGIRGLYRLKSGISGRIMPPQFDITQAVETSSANTPNRPENFDGTQEIPRASAIRRHFNFRKRAENMERVIFGLLDLCQNAVESKFVGCQMCVLPAHNAPRPPASELQVAGCKLQVRGKIREIVRLNPYI